MEELAYPSSAPLIKGSSALSIEQTAEQLRAYDAVRLFEESAHRIQRRFSLAEEGRAVVQICQQVEGMPLALELAAGQLRSLTCADLARETARNLDILATGQRNAHRRHLSVHVLFESSWAVLNPRQQQLLRRLAIFRAGFTQEAALMAAGGSLSLLTTLVEKSFLRLSTSGRYTLHTLVHQFAAEKLNTLPAERAATQAAHSLFYPKFFNSASLIFRGLNSSKSSSRSPPRLTTSASLGVGPLPQPIGMR